MGSFIGVPMETTRYPGLPDRGIGRRQDPARQLCLQDCSDAEPRCWLAVEELKLSYIVGMCSK